MYGFHDISCEIEKDYIVVVVVLLWVYYLAFFHSYAEAVLADTESFQEKLTKEMNDWLEKHSDDESVPEVSCFILDKELYSTLSLFTQAYKWVPATYCWGGGGGNPVMD